MNWALRVGEVSGRSEDVARIQHRDQEADQWRLAQQGGDGAPVTAEGVGVAADQRRGLTDKRAPGEQRSRGTASGTPGRPGGRGRRRLDQLGRAVDFVVVADAEALEAFPGGAVEEEVTPLAHHGDRVAEGKAAGRVGDDDDAATAVGELAQGRHQAPLQRRVQAAGRLVEQDHRRFPDQLDPAAQALALAPGEAADEGLGVLAEAQLLEDLLDRHRALGAAGVGRQAKARRVHQRLPDGEPVVEDVGLRDVADFGESQIDRVRADEHLTRAGLFDAGHAFEERRLPRAAGADQGDELARGHGQIGRLQDRPISDPHRDAGGGEASAALEVDDELVVLDPQAEGPDAGDRARSQRLGPFEQLVVQANAVARAEVDHRRRRPGPQLGVMPGDVGLLEADVVVRRPPDPQGATTDRDTTEYPTLFVAGRCRPAQPHPRAADLNQRVRADDRPDPGPSGGRSGRSRSWSRGRRS